MPLSCILLENVVIMAFVMTLNMDLVLVETIFKAYNNYRRYIQNIKCFGLEDNEWHLFWLFFSLSRYITIKWPHSGFYMHTQ